MKNKRKKFKSVLWISDNTEVKNITQAYPQGSLGLPGFLRACVHVVSSNGGPKSPRTSGVKQARNKAQRSPGVPERIVSPGGQVNSRKTRQVFTFD